VTLASSAIDELGMVVDFTDIKRLLGDWIEQHLDHRMMLHRDDPLAVILREQGEPLYLLDANPTAETIARLLFEQAQATGLPVVEVTFWETDDCHACYRPQ
jgi:6-pyruvoyltetrahydropterin/6-carboxytetrahydropterin synthase